MPTTIIGSDKIWPIVIPKNDCIPTFIAVSGSLKYSQMILNMPYDIQNTADKMPGFGRL